MRLAAFAALVALSACASTPPVSPDSQAAVEAAFADVVAVVSAPDTDTDSFAPLVAYRGGDAARNYRAPVDPSSATERAAASTLLAGLRAIVEGGRTADGRFVYEVAEYVHEPTDEADWHVLRLDVGVLENDQTSEMEAAFVPGPDGFLLARIAN
ncbi:hypothetical protein [Rubrivirga sp.]|uniref:hypothetical protein n=1 Tax=Rubrivirga sp. TaxID=1885344 RepID=UPI003C768BAB